MNDLILSTYLVLFGICCLFRWNEISNRLKINEQTEFYIMSDKSTEEKIKVAREQKLNLDEVMNQLFTLINNVWSSSLLRSYMSHTKT